MEEKKFCQISRDSVADIVSYLNEETVLKEDIISIMYADGEFKAVFLKKKK